MLNKSFAFLREHELGARIKTIKSSALSFSMGNSTYFIHYYFICTYSVFHCKNAQRTNFYYRVCYKIRKKGISIIFYIIS